MRKKLLIYETTHYETLPALVELALEQFEVISIYADSADVYDSCRHFTACQSSKIKWITRPATTSKRKFIKELFIDLSGNNYSHFFINSLDHNLYYFSQKLSRIDRNIQVVLNVHTIHDYTTTNRYNSIVNISESLAKQKLHRLIKNYRVLAPAMPAYLKSRLRNISVEYIPGMFYRFFDKTQIFEDDPDAIEPDFRIVIPGNVERKRREYEMIPEVAKLLRERLDQNLIIKMTILGNANSTYGKEVWENILSADGKAKQCFFIDLDYPTYAAHYSSADIIWSPIRLNTESIRGVPEINGLSNSAGFIVDFVHYARPSLIPSTIKISEELDPLVFRYTDAEDAASQLLKFINNPVLLQQKQQEIRTISSRYTADNFREAFKKLMNL